MATSGRSAGGSKVLSKSVRLFTGEGGIAIALEEIQHRRPEVEIGSYPFNRQGGYGTVIVVRGTDAAAITAAAADVVEMARGFSAQYEDDGLPPQ